MTISSPRLIIWFTSTGPVVNATLFAKNSWALAGSIFVSIIYCLSVKRSVHAVRRGLSSECAMDFYGEPRVNFVRRRSAPSGFADFCELVPGGTANCEWPLSVADDPASRFQTEGPPAFWLARNF